MKNVNSHVVFSAARDRPEPVDNSVQNSFTLLGKLLLARDRTLWITRKVITTSFCIIISMTCDLHDAQQA